MITLTAEAQEMPGFGLTGFAAEKRTTSFCRLPEIPLQKHRGQIWVSVGSDSPR